MTLLSGGADSAGICRWGPGRMTACVESTVIAWHENALEWLNLQGHVALPFVGDGDAPGPITLTSAETIDPFPWDGGMPQECYDNVMYLTKLLGGEPVYGWALADSGPLSERSQQQPPLYGRWINHVVWRDGGGKLWEVTPCFEVGNRARTAWRATMFAVDKEASFVLDGENALWARPSRYVALRSAGEPVAELLNRAEHAASEAERTRLLVMALADIASRGFTPKECRVETIGTHTNNIWLIAE